MDAGPSAQERALADLDVARQHDVVGEDRAVADPAVVSDVHVGHQEAAGADECRTARLRRAMEGDALADHVALADEEAGLGTLEGQVLRLAAQDRPLVHAVAAAQHRPGLDHGVGAHLAAVADRTPSSITAKGPTLTPGPRRA